nr:hypothetical protein [Alkalihalobacillus pseudalcaliphilus]
MTKTYSGYCIAGMDQNGEWVRPLPPDRESKFFSSLAYENGELVKVGDVWSITNYQTETDKLSVAHTEDIRIKRFNSFQLVNQLTNKALINFVSSHQESYHELLDTLDARGRSLCMIKIDEFRQVEEKVRITFIYKGKKYRNTTFTKGFPVTDLKWRAYLKGIQIPNSYRSIYAIIGLARKEPKKDIYKEYPMIISLITDPDVPILDSYPH